MGVMNKIEAKQIPSFNRQVLSIFIDDKILGEIVSAKAGDSRYKDLWCAWLLKNCQELWEQHGGYIWELIENKQNCNLPILLCPDDMDFWCTIVVAQVRYYDDIVVWEKIGTEAGKCDRNKWSESGIWYLEKWSESDWDLYDGTLAWLYPEDNAWDEWCSVNWLDEEKRRLWNYFHPYFNDDNNIKWFNCERLVFSLDDYNACVLAFKNYNFYAVPL